MRFYVCAEKFVICIYLTCADGFEENIQTFDMSIRLDPVDAEKLRDEITTALKELEK